MIRRDLRVLIVGQSAPTHVGSHFQRAARALALETELCDAGDAYAGPTWQRRTNWWLRGRRPARLDAFSRDVLHAAERFGPTVLLATGIAPVRADVLDRLGEMGIGRVNFLTDDPWNPVHRAPWFLDALGRYDHIFSPRHANLEDLRRVTRGEVHYLPFAYDPAVHFVEPPADEDAGSYAVDVMLAGGADKDRVAMVAGLKAAGLQVALYGGYWETFTQTAALARGHLDASGLRRATSAARVCLGLVRRANRDGHAMRSFEVPAMGGCLLAEDTREHRTLFGPSGYAVLYFATPQQAASQAARLVADPALRDRLALRARTIVTGGGHTYRDRLWTLLSRSVAHHAQDRDRRPGAIPRV